MSAEFKKFLYSFSQIIFQWSLVYLLVLFFLEDLRPFLVSSKFSPHWILLVVIFSSLGLLRFAKFGFEKEKNNKNNANKIDIWLINIFSLIISFMWLSFVKDKSWLLAIFIAILFFFVIKKSTLFLVKYKQIK